MSRKTDIEKMFEIVSKLDDTTVRYLLREMETALYVQTVERERYGKLLKEGREKK